jgi:hypothetical protein
VITTFAAGQDEIARRVKQFQTNLKAYHAPDYKEAHARQELIDWLFIALVDTLLQLHPRLAAAHTTHDRDLIQRQTPCPAVSGIDAADRQIDALVYQLYGLTDDEIKIVEGTA